MPPLSSARSAAVVLILGTGQMIASASGFYLMGVLADPIGRDLGLRPALISSLLSVALLASALVGPMAGRLIDARGGKPVLLASSLAFAAGLALLACAHGLLTLCLGMTVLGAALAIGMYETPFAILVGLHGEGARRGMAAVALLGGLGSTVGWPLTLWLSQTVGWRGACLAWAGVHLVIDLPLFIGVLPASAPRVSQSAPAPREPIAWDRRMAQLAVLFAGAWFVSTCMSAHLPRLLQGFGLTPGAAVAAASLVGVAAVAMRFLEFTILRRVSPVGTARVATLLHPVGAAALLTLGAVAAPALALGQGAGNGLLTVAKGVLPLKLYGPANYAYRSALIGLPARFTQAAGPVVYGLLLDRSPRLALMASAATCLVMFAATLGLGRGQAAQVAPAA